MANFPSPSSRTRGASHADPGPRSGLARSCNFDAGSRLLRAGMTVRKGITVIAAALMMLCFGLIGVAQAETPILQIETGGHLSLIRALQVTPDGKQLISAGDDKTIRIWDIGSGRLERVLRGEIGADDHGKIYDLAISPDGRLLAAGGPTGATGANAHPIRLYDLNSGEIIGLFTGHREPVLALAFSADGKMLASGGMDDTAIIFDVASLSQLIQLKGHNGDVNAVRFSGDGARLVTASDDKTLAMWQVSNGKVVAHMKGHGGIVFDAVFSADGKVLASGAADGTVRLWDALTGQFVKALPAAQTAVMSLSFSADGGTLIGGSGKAPFAVPAWDIASGTVRTAYQGHDNLVLAATTVADAGLGVTAGGSNNEIDIWDLKTGNRVKRLAGLGRAVFAAQFSRDGRHIAWGHKRQRRQINNWGSPSFSLRLPEADRPSGAPLAIRDLPLHGSVTVASGLELSEAVGEGSSFHDILEVRRIGGAIVRIRRTERDGYAHNAFTVAGENIVSGGGSGWLRHYDRAGRLLGDYSGHTSDVWAVSASLDGKYLVSGSDDQTVRLWNLKTRENIVSLFHASDGQWVMWTPQGYFNASPDGDEFIGWHVNKGPDKAAVFVTAARLKKHFYRPYIVDEAIRLASARDAVSRAENTSFSFNELTDKSPPAFKVVRVTSKIEDSAIRLELQLSLAAASQAPERLGVIVNGRNTFSSSNNLPGAGGGDVTIEIAGAPGRNLIEINLDNPVGITTQRIAVTAPEVKEPQRNRLYVLSIGVDDYQSFDQDLNFAAADAKAILASAKKFAGRLHQVVIGRLVADGQSIEPTADNIRQALELLGQARSNDTVIVFLAGHGINDGADYLFLPRDAKLADGRWAPETVINWRKLQDTLAATKGRRIMVIDTCHAGNAFNPRLIKDADDANITILAATDADTLAEERAELGHGVFTHSLLKGLGGAADAGSDGAVEARELGKFIKQSVRGLTDGKQSPVAHLPASGDFTVSRY